MSLDVEQLSPSAPKSAGRLTDRERLLCAHLALVRYLTRGQLWRLAYPGRSESVVSHRLKVLVSLGFLRHTRASGEPLEFRALDGRPVEVWALTLDGYRMALSVLGELPKVPTQDVGAPYLQHATGLVEFYLSMVGAGPERLGSKNRRGTRSAPTSPANLPPAPLPNGWAWVAGEMVRFPIAKKVKGIAPERLYLQPDSIIEWPGKRSRMFVEWETGTNPIVSQKSAALLSKFNRYEEFFRGFAEFNEGRTWYAQAFPDGWSASVLVVLHSERRKQNVASALRDWCQQDPTRTERNPFQLVTVPEAQQLLSLAIAQPHAAQFTLAAAPRTEAEERLRPGRVSVRGERLLALARYLSAFLHATEEARRAAAPPPPASSELLSLVKTLHVYGERGRAALAMYGIREAL